MHLFHIHSWYVVTFFVLYIKVCVCLFVSVYNTLKQLSFWYMSRTSKVLA